MHRVQLMFKYASSSDTLSNIPFTLFADHWYRWESFLRAIWTFTRQVSSGLLRNLSWVMLAYLLNLYSSLLSPYFRTHVWSRIGDE